MFVESDVPWLFSSTTSPPCFCCKRRKTSSKRIITRLCPASLVLRVILGRQTGRQQQRRARRLMEAVTGEANQKAPDSFCVDLLLPRLSRRLRLPVIHSINSPSLRVLPLPPLPISSPTALHFPSHPSCWIDRLQDGHIYYQGF